MNEYIKLDLNNIDKEHICCAIGDPKHQDGVDKKKEWIKRKLKDGHVFRRINARGKIFIEYEPIETAWVPINGKNYMHIYCLWVAGSFKGKGIGRELLEYAVEDAKNKRISGVCTLVSQKKKPFIGDKKFFEHYGFKVVDTINDYELMALQFDDKETPKDGNEYTSSIKEMYPDDIENKAINFQWKDDTLIKEVRNYYSDLKDKSIYYYSGDKNNNGEYIKLDK